MNDLAPGLLCLWRRRDGIPVPLNDSPPSGPRWRNPSRSRGLPEAFLFNQSLGISLPCHIMSAYLRTAYVSTPRR